MMIPEAEAVGGVNWLRSCPIHSRQPIDTRNKEVAKQLLVDALLSNERGRQSLNAYSFHLGQVGWAVFGTLTWKQDSRTYCTDGAEALRQKDFHWLIGMTCGRLHLRPKRLAFYRKTEWGKNGRGHFNFLIALEGTGNITPTVLAATMQDVWCQPSEARGLSQIEPFNTAMHLEGITYQSKYEFDPWGNQHWLVEEISPALRKLFVRNAITN